MADADSEEFNKDAPNHVVMYMPEVLPFLLGLWKRQGFGLVP